MAMAIFNDSPSIVKGEDKKVTEQVCKAPENLLEGSYPEDIYNEAIMTWRDSNSSLEKSALEALMNPDFLRADGVMSILNRKSSL